MNNPSIIPPSVFISYCWSSPSHELWVINLAQELMDSGVQVTIDKWDLKEGNDLYSFMEEMVNSETIDKVLCIIDKNYSEKANTRTGGVGVESQIISPEIYKNSKQDKFIPIITELDENGDAIVPVFFKGKVYIDFSDVSSYSDSFDKLLRNLYKRPNFTKPKLGTPPRYLFDDAPNLQKSNMLVRDFEKKIEKNPYVINSLLREFLNQFITDLVHYELKLDNNSNIEENSKLLHDSICYYVPLRDNYIEFIDILIKSNIVFDFNILIEFFEKLSKFTYPRESKDRWMNIEFELYKFVIHELFLYTVTLAYKHEKYNLIVELLYGDYFLYEIYQNHNEPKRFDNFYYFEEGLTTYYRNTFQGTFLNPAADIMIKRINDKVELDLFVESDLICHYVSILEGFLWFPITYIYKKNRRFDIFDKLVSKKHFHKVKILFGVNTPEELKEKLIQLSENYPHRNGLGYFKTTRNIIPIFQIIPTDKLCTLR